MKRILANDGIADEGKKLLEEAGFEVVTEKVPQDKLRDEINNFDVLIVRSATKVNKDVMENASRLKLVVRAGVGVDNIDIAYAKEKGIEVANTPQSSSLSVAELVFAHLFAMTRFLHSSNRELTLDGNRFNELKKHYSEGKELRGKTLGVIGFGRIGQETAKIAISLGMKVLAYDYNARSAKLHFHHLPFKPVPMLEVHSSPLNEVIANSDFISLHVPHKEGMPPMIGTESFARMKDGVGIVNCARGGVIDETALLNAINSGKVAYAGLDVFEGEPKIKPEILKNPHISVSPHIGASTVEAQDRIGQEVAQVVIQKYKQN
jgi:D-3-phosphoglycerate dehydrogenase / 2-oxoglutarate reductase